MKTEYFTLVDKLSPSPQNGFIRSTGNVLHNSSWGRCVTWNVLCLELLLFMIAVDLEFWDGKQNSVPYMWEVILNCVPFGGGVVVCILVVCMTCVNGFPDWSCMSRYLHTYICRQTYYAKVLQCFVVTCVGLVFIYGWRCLEMFIILFTKSHQ